MGGQPPVLSSQVVTFEFVQPKLSGGASLVGGSHASDAADLGSAFPQPFPGAAYCAPGFFLETHAQASIRTSFISLSSGNERGLDVSPLCLSTAKGAGESSTQRLGRCMRAVYGQQRNAYKVLARRISRTPRAVRGWMDGECGPQFDALLDLCADHDEIAEFVLVLIRERKRSVK